MSFITSGIAVLSVTYAPAVTGLTATNPTNSTVDLAWTSSRGATSYSIVSTPATTTQTTSGTSYTFTGLSSGTSYTFTVTSVGPVGPGGSTTSGSITTSAPPDPNVITNFTATVTSPGHVRLDWTPPTNPSGVGVYNLYTYLTSEGFGYYSQYLPTGLPPILTGGSPGDYFGISASFYDMTDTPFVYASVP